MNIERFINRLRYAFYIVEKIDYRAYRRVISTEIGFLTGIECNLLSIIGFKKNAFVRSYTDFRNRDYSLFT